MIFVLTAGSVFSVYTKSQNTWVCYFKRSDDMWCQLPAIGKTRNILTVIKTINRSRCTYLSVFGHVSRGEHIRTTCCKTRSDTTTCEWSRWSATQVLTSTSCCKCASTCEWENNLKNIHVHLQYCLENCINNVTNAFRRRCFSRRCGLTAQWKANSLRKS